MNNRLLTIFAATFFILLFLGTRGMEDFSAYHCQDSHIESGAMVCNAADDDKTKSLPAVFELPASHAHRYSPPMFFSPLCCGETGTPGIIPPNLLSSRAPPA